MFVKCFDLIKPWDNPSFVYWVSLFPRAPSGLSATSPVLCLPVWRGAWKNWGWLSWNQTEWRHCGYSDRPCWGRSQTPDKFQEVKQVFCAHLSPVLSAHLSCCRVKSTFVYKSAFLLDSELLEQRNWVFLFCMTWPLSKSPSLTHTAFPLVNHLLWRRWQPTPVFLPGKFHGPRSLAGYNPWVCKESEMTELLLSMAWHHLPPNWSFCFSDIPSFFHLLGPLHQSYLPPRPPLNIQISTQLSPPQVTLIILS